MSWSRIAKKKQLPSSKGSSKPIKVERRKKAEVLPFSPHKYQRKAIKFLLERGAAGLFLDPGLGKTSITLAAIKLLLKQKLIDKVLIIAPLRVVYYVLPAEIK